MGWREAPRTAQLKTGSLYLSSALRMHIKLKFGFQDTENLSHEDANHPKAASLNLSFVLNIEMKNNFFHFD
jgi:hypothetical protein